MYNGLIRVCNDRRLSLKRSISGKINRRKKEFLQGGISEIDFLLRVLHDSQDRFLESRKGEIHVSRINFQKEGSFLKGIKDKIDKIIKIG